MAAVGGDLQEILINHPTKGSFVLFPMAGQDSTFDPGGFRVNDDESGIDGGGRMVKQMNRIRWSLECTVSWDMNDTEEMENLKGIAGDPADAEITVTHASGAIYRGTGTLVGDLKPNGNAATIGIKLAGGGEMSKL